jgi:hypothetical protein
MFAGGAADGVVFAAGGAGAALAAGAARVTDSTAADAAIRDRLAGFKGAGTVGNVSGAAAGAVFPLPPRAVGGTLGSDTGAMKLSRPLSWFLLAFGVWSWIIWVTFVKNLVKDGSGLAFDNGQPTAYFWVHLTLAVVSFILGTVIGGIGLRGLRALRRAQ